MKRLRLRDQPPSDLDQILQRASCLIDSKVGIIKQMIEGQIEQDDPLIHTFAALMTDTSRYAPQKSADRNGGAGLTRKAAQAATIGEAIERYGSNFYDPRDLVFGSYTELRRKGYEAVPPGDFPLFSERQYAQDPFPKPFTEAAPINWTWGYSLIDETPKLVPACFTYLPYSFQDGETHIGPSISTGMSCGSTLEHAILYGLYECIERDAFIIMWLNRLTPPVVELEEGTSIGKLFRDKFAVSNIQYTICDITTDIPVPTFYALAIGESSMGQLVCVGSATRLNPEQVIEKVLIETAQARPYMRWVLDDNPNWTCRDDFGDLLNFDDHGRLYSSRPELVPHITWVVNLPSRKVSEISNLSKGSTLADLYTCLNILAERGYDVIVVDLTTPDVAQGGLYAVRVFIPKLQHLHGTHNLRFLGGRRLYEVPRLLGYTQKNTCEEDLNPWPHPFP